MRSLLSIPLLVAASASAQTYAPLLPTSPGESFDELVAPNYFGGSITSTITILEDGFTTPFIIAASGASDFTYITQAAIIASVNQETLFEFSASITRFIVGWAAPTGSSGFTYTVYDGATQVNTGFVPTISTTGSFGNSYLDFTRLEGFTSVLISVGPEPYALGYGAVPEPSTYGLILGGLALAGAAVRRRKNSK